jgi:hypothetical protein
VFQLQDQKEKKLWEGWEQNQHQHAQRGLMVTRQKMNLMVVKFNMVSSETLSSIILL